LLVEELMKRADDKYVPKPTVVEGTTEGNLRIENGKRLLREAAAEARRVVQAQTLDFSSGATAERAWLQMVLTRLAREILAHGPLHELRDIERIRDEKLEQRRQSHNGKQHFIKIAEDFERLADNLTLADLDPDSNPLPTSFEQFRKSQG
jgi:hypothetical protein